MRFFAVLLATLFCIGALAASQSTVGTSSLILGADYVPNEDELLEPDQAFKLAVTVQDGPTVLARFTPAATYYLYRDRVKFSVDGRGINIAGTDMPPGEVKEDATFGQTRVFHGPFSARVNLKREPGSSDKVKLTATYQGCADKGVCYPPITKTFDLVLAADASGAAGPDASPPAQTPAPSKAESGAIGEILTRGGLWLVVGVFFIAGIGLAFTPCVLPMIPILSGIIAGQGQTMTRSRGFALSLAYVFGMAITYALAGIAAGLSGSILAATLQNAWVLGGFALVFVALSLSMFGVYDLHMPAGIRHGASMLSHRLTSGRLAGVFAMGALSALIVSPCVAAPLAGALLYISQTRDVALGGTALFAMALGMGVPLMLVGVSAGALLPRAGPWMGAVKRFFGVLLLAVAIWIVSPVIPMVMQMLLWAVLLIISAIFLRATDSLPHEASGYARLGKGIGMIALVGGVALLIGALSGSRDPLQPLASLRGGGAVDEIMEVGFERVRTLADLEERLRTTDRPVMLDFYADWCVSCKEMEQFTYRDARVAERLQDLLLLQVDVTANNADDQALLKRFGLFGPPGIIFFNGDGKEIRNLRVVGYQPAETFMHAIEDALRSGFGTDKATFTMAPDAAPATRG